MKTIAEQILDGLSRFYAAFQTRRVLKTMEEVNANTDAQNIPSALLLGELNNKLSGFEPVLDSTGRMIGYKTAIGGADTVYPFRRPYSGSFNLSWSTSSGGYYGNVSFPVAGYSKLVFSNIKIGTNTVLHFKAAKENGTLLYDRNNPGGSYDISDCVFIQLYVSTTGGAGGGASGSYRLE